MPKIKRWLESPGSTNVIGAATLVLVVGVVIVAWLVVPTLLSNTSASRRTDEISGCRGQARTEIDTANLAAIRGNAAMMTGVADAVVAAIADDDAALLAASDEIAAGKSELNTAVINLTMASSAYAVAVSESLIHPDDFLTTCRKGTP